MLSKFYLYIVILVSIPFSLTAQLKTEISWKMVDNILIPVPPPEHPRLYLRSSQAAEIEARLKHPVLQPVIEELRALSARILAMRRVLPAE
jgi:hypothetical protein